MRIRKSHLCFLAAAVLGTTSAGGEENPRALRLTVEEAVFMALENNRSLAAQRLEPLIAGTFAERERALFDPVLYGEISYSEDRVEAVSRATGERFSVEGEDTRALVGIGTRLPTGTDIDLTLGHQYSLSDRTPEQHAARLGLNVTQALLRGRGPAANLARVRQARLDLAASEYELRGYTEAFVAEIETAYWDFVLAERQMEIYEESLDVARRQKEVTGERIEVGQLPGTERAAAEAEMALRSQALIDARGRRELTRLRLINLLSPSPEVADWDSPLTALAEPTVPEAELEEAGEHAALARRHRPELAEGRLRLQRQDLEVVQTRNGLLPRLDLFISLGKTGFAESFSSAFRDLDGNGYDATIGVRFEHELGNRGRGADNRRARFVRRQAEEGMRNLENLIELDVRSAWQEVARAREQVAASAATRRLQEEVLRAEMERFEVGRSTALAVAQAQRDLLASSITEVESAVEVRRALIRLYRMEGTLLVRRGIDA